MIGIEFVNYYAEVSKSNDDSKLDVEENKEDQDLIDDTEIKNNPSDYYGILNVTRSVSDAENDARSETDSKTFINKDQNARNNCLHSEDEKEDEFIRSKAQVAEFKDTLHIAHGKK